MAYIEDRFYFPNSIEVEIKWAGNYGAKGEKRAPKEKPTPEQIEKQNQWRKERDVRRLIKANFKRGDYWITFVYPQQTRKEIGEVQKDISKLQEKLRYRYKVWWNTPYKWINRIEIGSCGGIHCHMLVNAVEGADLDLEIQTLWNNITGGRAHFERFMANEDSSIKVANYLVKPLTDQQKKRLEDMDLDPAELTKYSSSRNLKRPKPVRKYYRRKTLRKIVETGEPIETKGYKIDKNSIIFGVNRFTGLSYLYYTEIADGGEP